MTPPETATTEPPALHVGDRLRVTYDFLARATASPTVVLTVVNITTTADGVKILAVRPPAGPGVTLRWTRRPRWYRGWRGLAVRQGVDYLGYLVARCAVVLLRTRKELPHVWIGHGSHLRGGRGRARLAPGAGAR